MTSTMIWTTIVAQAVKQVTFATDSVDDGLSYPENKSKMAYSRDLPKMVRQQCGIMD